jgi:hypothetical protein
MTNTNMQPLLTSGLNCSPSGQSDTSTRISTPADMKLERSANIKSPFGSQHQSEYCRLPMSTVDEHNIVSTDHIIDNCNKTSFPIALHTRGQSPLKDTHGLICTETQLMISPSQEINGMETTVNDGSNRIPSTRNHEEFTAVRNITEMPMRTSHQDHQENNRASTSLGHLISNSERIMSPRLEDGIFKQAISSFGNSLLTNTAAADVRAAQESFSSTSASGYSELFNRYRLEQISKHLHGFPDPRISLSFASGNHHEHS